MFNGVQVGDLINSLPILFGMLFNAASMIIPFYFADKLTMEVWRMNQEYVRLALNSLITGRGILI